MMCGILREVSAAPWRENQIMASTVHQQASQVAQWKRIHLPMQTPQETRVRSLGREDPLEEEMETHSHILAWIIPRTEEPMASCSAWPRSDSHENGSDGVINFGLTARSLCKEVTTRLHIHARMHVH